MLLSPIQTRKRVPTKAKTFKIPVALINWIIQHAEENNKSQAQVLNDALREAKKKDDAEKRQQQE